MALTGSWGVDPSRKWALVIVRLALDSAVSVWLVGRETFTAFHVEAAGPPDAVRLNDALTHSQTGFATSAERAHIAVDALRRLAGTLAECEEWEKQLQSMLSFADTKGWYNPTAGTISAHVVWIESAYFALKDPLG